MSETTLSAMPRTILRPEDAVRLPRPYRLDDRDRTRASSEDTRPRESSIDTTSTEDMTSSVQSIKPPSDPDPEPLSAEETIDKARRAVEEGRQITQDALAGGEAVSEAVRPKLTIDLGHSRIARIPEPVVDLIKNEVERLSLSHNQIWHIPYRFEECAQLRYLNIRTNHFREFPKAVYKLPLLEILDISRNRIRKIPEEIKSLTSLRVFSMMHNKIEDLPSTLCDMNKLQILKVAENPLRFRLKRVVDQKETEVTRTMLSDNEKEIAITAEIKRFLLDERRGQNLATPVESESGGEGSETTVDTPKPLKRVLSSRFPVIPSTAGASPDSPADMTIKSPAQSKPPPIPTRSHYRIQSGQNNSLLRRPGVSPLSIGNERNRSNSESILQAGAAPRTRRMNILRKEKTDLDTVEEGPTNRYSHLRGHSYASALRTNVTVLGDSPAESASSSSPESPNDGRSRRMAYGRRLSSLPEHKEDTVSYNPLLEGAKGILYALYQVHPQVSALINVAKAGEPRRSSLEVLFFTASTHIEQLNDVLENAGTIDEEEGYRADNLESNIKTACVRCIKSYTAISLQLQQYVPKIIACSDPRYVRTTMLLLYGSIMEIRNACVSLGVDIRPKTMRAVPVSRSQSTSGQTIKATTKPVQDRSLSRPGLRFRSDTAIQHPTLNTMVNDVSNMVPQQAQAYPQNFNMTGSTMNQVSYNGNTYGTSNFTGTTLSNGDSRSRSNSRAATLSSLSSSVASTPRSGDTFIVPPPNTSMHRINTVTGMSEAEEERIFEQIFLSLTRAYHAAEQSLPIAKRHFARCLQSAEESRSGKEARDIWQNLIQRCKTCMDLSEALHARLVNMKVKDPTGGRNQRDFWILCKTFMQSFIDLAIDMRDAKSAHMLPTEVIVVLRPVQKASREAGRLIDVGPWSWLADNSGTAAMPNGQQYSGGNVYGNAMNGTQFLPTQNGGNGISPVSVPIPATPLSAALGPAAQATVPSTPASAYGDQFFAGNVFQRADSLLNMSQASGMPMYNRRA